MREKKIVKKMKKICEKEIKYFNEKNIKFFCEEYFPLKIAIGICLYIDIGIGIGKFCKEYSPLKKSNKISYLRLKIISG